jgi:F0F1-type ATP synthase assembly protein I
MRARNAGKERAGAAAKKAKKAAGNREKAAKQRRHAKGFFIGIGIVSGTCFGVPYGLATASPEIVLAGLVIGTALGTAYEQKYNHGVSALAK